MRLSMTQGVVAVDLSLTRQEAVDLLTILNVSHKLLKNPASPEAARVEETMHSIFAELYGAGLRVDKAVVLR
jgi:hypothetical protein